MNEIKLTRYQQAQLQHIFLTGDFRYRNARGNKAPRKAWVKMIDTLTNNELIDDDKCQLTPKGIRYILAHPEINPAWLH